MTRAALSGLLLASLASLASTACGGSWETGEGSSPIAKSAPGPVPVKQQGPVKSDDRDGGVAQPAPDKGPAAKPDAKPAAAKPDTLPPDTSPPPPPPPKTGGPCPCAAGQMCISGVCRATCAAPTGSCSATSTCAATEACLHVQGSATWVCLPAAAPGAACDQNTFCPNGHVCGSVNGGPYHCLPTCQAGKACAKGSCLAASAGCSFCTSL